VKYQKSNVENQNCKSNPKTTSSYPGALRFSVLEFSFGNFFILIFAL